MSATFLDHYRLMAKYNRWLNERLYAACESLTDAERKRDRGAFFGSIHQTLTHLVLADKMWLQRFAQQGVAFPALEPGLLHLPAGADYTSALHPDWRASNTTASRSTRRLKPGWRTCPRYFCLA